MSHSPTQIYGGERTDSPESVGALVHKDSSNSFCTATLITTDWLITAAHCLEDETPDSVRFTLSGNANFPDTPLYDVKRFVTHPEYHPTTFINDIALVQLETHITDKTLPKLNMTSLDDDFINASPSFVGYGFDESRESGIRRTADIPVYSVGIATFTSIYTDETETGACFGDSGGPVFYEFDSSLTLIGVISNILSGDNNDPCIGSYDVTRIDQYRQWILSQIDATADLPSCSDDSFNCFCDEACTSDGTCDNTKCGEMTCEESYDCVGACDAGDGACMNNCHLQTQNAELYTFESFLECGNNQCLGLTENDLFECLVAFCHDSFHSCFSATDCDILGGDCDDDSTCRPGRYTLTACEPSAGKSLGTRCTPEADPYQCGDGLMCTAIDGKYVCGQLCFSDEDCDDEECIPKTNSEFRGEPLSVCTISNVTQNNSGCAFSLIASQSIINLLF